MRCASCHTGEHKKQMVGVTQGHAGWAGGSARCAAAAAAQHAARGAGAPPPPAPAPPHLHVQAALQEEAQAKEAANCEAQHGQARGEEGVGPPRRHDAGGARLAGCSGPAATLGLSPAVQVPGFSGAPAPAHRCWLQRPAPPALAPPAAPPPLSAAARLQQRCSHGLQGCMHWCRRAGAATLGARQGVRRACAVSARPRKHLGGRQCTPRDKPLTAKWLQEARNPDRSKRALMGAAARDEAGGLKDGWRGPLPTHPAITRNPPVYPRKRSAPARPHSSNRPCQCPAPACDPCSTPPATCSARTGGRGTARLTSRRARTARTSAGLAAPPSPTLAASPTLPVTAKPLRGRPPPAGTRGPVNPFPAPSLQPDGHPSSPLRRHERRRSAAAALQHQRQGEHQRSRTRAAGARTGASAAAAARWLGCCNLSL